VPIDNTLGGDIRSKVLPWNFKGPVPTMFTLLQFLVSGATEITSVSDVMTGEAGQANEPYHSFAIRVSEGMKVFSAIYKRIHRSLKQEYKKLYRLNKIYLSDQEYFRVLDTQLSISQADYNTLDLDIIPVSDPTIATSVQKAAKGRMLLEVGANNPRFKQYEIYENAMRAFGVNDVDTFLLKDEEMPKPQPDPKIIELQGKLEKMSAETEKIQAETVETYANMQQSVVKIQQDFEKLDIEKLAQMIELLSKVVTEPENLATFREATGSETVNSTGIPRLEPTPDYAEVDAVVDREETGSGDATE
jgi:chaperonin GroES